MKIVFLFFSLLFITFQSCSQNQKPKKFNLDFEIYSSRYLFPKDWIEWGDYRLSADSLNAHFGKYSGKISSEKRTNSFGSIAYAIPANYEGETIQLEGYMKIKDVENGFAGLLLRIDDKHRENLAFDNMKTQNINGTKDWQKYKIILSYPENAETIYVAGILVGTGEAWFDDFELTIDGKNIQTLKEIEKPILNANLDKTFDLGSNITFSKLNDKQIKNLDLLGKVWGFLKYHHPEIAKGNYNWDYELFRFLPEYNKVKTNAERDALLINWIDNLGRVEPCKPCKDTSENTFLKPDHTWINAFGLSTILKDILNHIYKNRYQGNGFYINAIAGRVKFMNENKYYNMSYNDTGFKLLALYRYWNMIHYFFPYKHLTDKDWNSILKEYIPKFINSKNKLEYELNTILLISEINDTHATNEVGFNNVQNRRGEYYPPFKLQFIQNKFVVTDYYNPEFKDASKVKAGDIITHINEKPIESIVDSISPYYPASNKTSKLRDISRDLLRSNEKEINIKYISNNQNKQLLLPLYKESDLNMNWHKWKDGKCYKMLDGNIGYITLQFIKKEDIPVIKETFKNTKGIIIDIRNYPSAFVPFLLGTYFVSDNAQFAKFTYSNINNPGEFITEKGTEIPKPKETYKGKLVVLINEDSQSQSEYTAMAFRAGDNTTIVGNTTAGADGNVVSMYLPGGLLTRISGIGVYYPDGSETQRIGIIPDIEIKPTIEGIKSGKDELLQKAIEVINNK